MCLYFMFKLEDCYYTFVCPTFDDNIYIIVETNILICFRLIGIYRIDSM